MPTSSALRVTSIKRAASSVTFPTGIVMAESPYQPSTTTPKSMLQTSPSRRTRLRDGMPWTISSLTEMQITPGKGTFPPWEYPLNAGFAPYFSMSDSASSSSSPVLTPGRAAAATSRRIRPTMRPAARIFSISAALFRITPIGSALQGRADARVDLVRAAHAVDLDELAQLPVVLLHLGNLGAEHLEPLDQDLLGNLEADHLVDLQAHPSERLLERLRLGKRPREAVEERALPHVAGAEPLLDQPDHQIVGNQPPLAHEGLRLLAQLG